MAIASRPKPKTTHHKKRTAAHHRQTKHYVKSYWPYLPMLLIAGFGMLLNTQLGQPAAVLGAASDVSAQSLLLATNHDRETNQLPDIGLSTQLMAAAQQKAADMVSRNYWSHQTPDGQQPWSFVTAQGYQFQSAGENLAFGFNSADAVNNAWLHSPEHRANILDQNYTQVGFGVAQSSDFMGKGPETIVVALYARPVAAGAPAHPGATHAPVGQSNVSRISSMATPATSGLALGILGTLAIISLVWRHTAAWRKLLKRGEQFAINHPMIDVAFMVVAVAAVLLNQTAGFIR